MKDIRVGYIHKWGSSNSINIYQNQPRFTDGRLDNDFIKVKITIEGLDACPTDPECPFCECKEPKVWNCEDSEGEFAVCSKCGKIIKPTQKPKIEELIHDRLCIARIDPEKRAFITELQKTLNYFAEKIQETISAVNKLYER